MWTTISRVLAGQHRPESPISHTSHTNQHATHPGRPRFGPRGRPYDDEHGGPVRLHPGRPGYRLGRPASHGRTGSPTPHGRAPTALGLPVAAVGHRRSRRVGRTRPDRLAHRCRSRGPARRLAGALSDDGAPEPRLGRRVPRTPPARCPPPTVAGGPRPHRSLDPRGVDRRQPHGRAPERGRGVHDRGRDARWDDACVADDACRTRLTADHPVDRRHDQPRYRHCEREYDARRVPTHHGPPTSRRSPGPRAPAVRSVAGS